jgi:cell division protein FtsI/penicillin-binding protein 2
VVFAATTGGAVFALGHAHNSGPGADPRSPATALVAAWQAGDYKAMYRTLTPHARKLYPFATFQAAYRNAAYTATLRRVRANGPVRATAGAATAPVVLNTSLFGHLTTSLRVPLVKVDDRYRVEWSPALTFPGLADGQHLARQATAPQRRGAILAADHSVLARGPAAAREYPQGSSFALITGYVAAPKTRDAIVTRRAAGWPAAAAYGQGGLEESLDPVLGGQPRIRLQAVGGATPTVLATRPGVPAHNVVTTLSVTDQEAATTALGDQEGGVVVLDARTGALLASAGLGMDGTQPPGSTFKTVTGSAALATGKAHLTDTFPALRNTLVGGFKLRNFHGELCGGTLVDAYALSCNTVFGPLADKVGGGPLYQLATSLGFNRKPSIAYPAATSVTPSRATLESSDSMLGIAGIGQGGVDASPLQMASVAQAVASGGLLRPPWLLRGPHHATDHRQPRRVMPRATAAEMTQMMQAVVSYGTGTSAASGVASIAGKTGTAEVAPGTKSDAWFIGFAPAQAPRVAVAVLVVHGGVGGKVAAPIARSVIDTALTGG